MAGESQATPGQEPDPTVLTTEQLLREVEGLKDLVTAKMEGLKDVFAERFKSVETQFGLVERQRVEQKKDTKDAVDAALAAAKEAVKEQTTASGAAIAKSENSTTEQLRQLNTTFATAISGVTRSFDDLKERVGKIESVKLGGKETLSGIYALVGFVVTVVTVLTVLAATGVFSGNGSP